jgi:hypothetical protein
MQEEALLARRREANRKRMAAWRANLSPELAQEFRERQKNKRQTEEYREQRQKYRRSVAGKERFRKQQRDSQRRVRLKRFGLTVADYEAMLKAQDGKCAICGTVKPARGNGHYSFPVDHCHKTGRVRGLLCHTCNVTLGRFNDCPEEIVQWAEKAAKYLT